MPAFGGLAIDPRFADAAAPNAPTMPSSPMRWPALFADGGKDDWERTLRAADVACVAVHTGTIEDMYWSEGFGVAGDYLTWVEHPVFDLHPRMKPLVRFSRSATQAGSANVAGFHTDSLLTELGKDPAADRRPSASSTSSADRPGGWSSRSTISCVSDNVVALRMC